MYNRTLVKNDYKSPSRVGKCGNELSNLTGQFHPVESSIGAGQDKTVAQSNCDRPWQGSEAEVSIIRTGCPFKQVMGCIQSAEQTALLVVDGNDDLPGDDLAAEDVFFTKGKRKTLFR